MKFSLAFTLLILFFNQIFGQINNNKYDYFLRKIQIAGNSDSKIVVNKNNGDTTFQAYYNSKDVVNNTQQEFIKTYKGTPFFKNAWHKGEISTQSGKVMEFLMAYNMQKNELYIVEDVKKDAITIKPESFTILGHHFSKFENAYYEVVHISKNTLLKEYSCVLHSSNTEKTGYDSSGEYEGEFVKSSKYFILKDESVVQMPRGKNFFNLFGDKKLLVELYAKANNLNLKTENGLVSTFKYYDSLENPQ
jgi:hypothetical protein